MNLFNKVMAAISGPSEPEEQPHEEQRFRPPARPLITIDAQKMHSMVLELNIDRIRRTMMLFDIRWIDDQSVAYIPNEEQIAQAAYMNMANAVISGRVLGAAEVRDKGFCSTFLVLPTGNEVLSTKYVLSEVSNIR